MYVEDLQVRLGIRRGEIESEKGKEQTGQTRRASRHAKLKIAFIKTNHAHTHTHIVVVYTVQHGSINGVIDVEIKKQPKQPKQPYYEVSF